MNTSTTCYKMCTVLYCTLTILYSTVLYCTVQYSTILYSTVYTHVSIICTYMYSTLYIPCGMTPAHSTLAFSDSNVESGVSWKTESGVSWKTDIGNDTVSD